MHAYSKTHVKTSEYPESLSIPHTSKYYKYVCFVTAVLSWAPGLLFGHHDTMWDEHMYQVSPDQSVRMLRRKDFSVIFPSSGSVRGLTDISFPLTPDPWPWAPTEWGAVIRHSNLTFVRPIHRLISLRKMSSPCLTWICLLPRMTWFKYFHGQ